MGQRLFVCEFVTGGGLSGRPLPASLCREGDMMLRALVKDLLDLPAVEIVLTRDCRLPTLDLPVEVRPIGNDGDPWPAWRQVAEASDAAWPIAPETGGALERLARLALESGCRLIGSRPDAVALTASKRATADLLLKHGLPAPPTVALATPFRASGDWFAGRPPGSEGWVVKPDDGAGAEETYLFRQRTDLDRWLATCPDRHRFVLQPHIAGAAASLSMLCHDGRAWLLSCNHQHVVVENGRFAYRGGIVGGLERRRVAYEPIAAGIAAAIPGLSGYVGVDLVDGPDGPAVIEVNPRLTTSYAGLRAAIGANPAALLLDFPERGRAEWHPLRVTPQAVAVEVADA